MVLSETTNGNTIQPAVDLHGLDLVAESDGTTTDRYASPMMDWVPFGN